MRLTLEPENGSGATRWLLRVQDHGQGMSPQELERVGERFWRADASGQVPGTGLGVSIVREIVALHGGTLGFHSELGRGTCVTVALPGLASPFMAAGNVTVAQM